MAIYNAPESMHVGTGTETVFGFNWPYLLPRDLIVTVNGQPVPTVLASPNQVVVAPAPAPLAIVRIYRNTPAQNPTYLFATGIPMLPKYIDGNNKQLLYALQEGLLQFAQTQATAEAALIRAAAAEIAAKRAEEYAAQQARDIRRTVRTPTTDPEIPTLPSAGDRANKVLGFDSLGNPVGTLPASGSGTELALDLANKSDAGKGAGQIGFRGKWLSDYLDAQESYLTVEYFGPVDTPANTRLTMQAAVDFCAANGVLLRARATVYTLDVSAGGITIPDNFRCDFGGAWIRRATGNKTPHDMWINADTANGNTGLSIKGVRFDGRAQIDSLSNAVAAHRFCGLRLVRCEGKLADIRADATCNGEIQDEGIRGGIMLEESVFMDCEKLRTDLTVGTGLLIRGGRGRLSNFQSNNNSGSGMSGDQPGWVMDTLSSIGSGYSGISLNGPGFNARGIYGSGAALGYAGVNFGHATPASSHGIDSIATDVVAENNAGWGINATSCPGIRGTNWVAMNSGVDNIRLLNSPGAKVSLTSRGAARNGVLIDGPGKYDVSAEVTGCAGNGVYGRNGSDIELSAGSVVTKNGRAGDLVAGVTLDTSSKARVRGRVFDNLAFGVQSVGGSTLVVEGGTVTGNRSGNTRQADGGVLRYEKAKFSNDPMSGTFTILAGTNSSSTANGNVIDINQISFQPANASARTAGLPFVSTYQPGVSLTAQIAGSAATDAIYRYVLI